MPTREEYRKSIGGTGPSKDRFLRDRFVWLYEPLPRCCGLSAFELGQRRSGAVELVVVGLLCIIDDLDVVDVGVVDPVVTLDHPWRREVRRRHNAGGDRVVLSECHQHVRTRDGEMLGYQALQLDIENIRTEPTGHVEVAVGSGRTRRTAEVGDHQALLRRCLYRGHEVDERVLFSRDIREEIIRRWTD